MYLNHIIAHNYMSEVTYEGLRFYTTVNKFLVRMDKNETVTKGGIIIPSTAKKRTDFSGVVVAVSRGIDRDDSEIKVGDRVILAKGIKRVVPTDDNDNEYRLYQKSELSICMT